jgi:hypothetical protein
MLLGLEEEERLKITPALLPLAAVGQVMLIN